MFSMFFYLLRARGVKVSLTEWLGFVEGLDKGLYGGSFSGFYYMARALLVKSEADFDKFDRCFLEFFKDVADADSDELPQELLDWLNNPDVEDVDFDPEAVRGERFAFLSDDEIRRMFEERLKEQHEEHNGGEYWIGTHGASPFGNSGVTPKGIRVGGVGRRRLAMEVAGERRYRDFRGDSGLNARSFQMAFRRLRQFSSRVDAPRTELDVDGSIRATCENAGHLELVFGKPRKNTVKLLLLMDSGGSMDPYSDLCGDLFQAVSKSNHFKDLCVYYFHNCFKRLFYKSPFLDSRASVEAEWLLNNIDGEYKVIVVGDALMSPRELTGGYRPGKELSPTGLVWLRRFRDRYRNFVWLTPSDNEGLVDSVWGASYGIIKKEVPIYPLTVETLAGAFKKLMAPR